MYLLRTVVLLRCFELVNELILCIFGIRDISITNNEILNFLLLP